MCFLYFTQAANHSMAIQLTQANATVDVLNNKGQNPLFLLLDNPADKVLSSKETVDVLLESSLFIRLVDLDNNLPTSLRIPNVPRELRQLLEMQSTAPPSLYKMALHKTRRCLGFKNTSNIGTLELDCPPGLKDQIAWNWKKVVDLWIVKKGVQAEIFPLFIMKFGVPPKKTPLDPRAPLEKKEDEIGERRLPWRISYLRSGFCFYTKASRFSRPKPYSQLSYIILTWNLALLLQDSQHSHKWIKEYLLLLDFCGNLFI